MLDKLSANISEFGNSVLPANEFVTKFHKKSGPNGMVCGLKENRRKQTTLSKT
jgi:hypothetical protein